MESSVVALFSVNPMYFVNLMSVKAMLHCIVFYGLDFESFFVLV